MLHLRCVVMPTSQPLYLHFSSLVDVDQIPDLFCTVKVGHTPSILSQQKRKKKTKRITHQMSASAEV